MNLRFDTTLARNYKSKTQIARVLTEDWLARNMYCPICGEVSIMHADVNAPVKDFVCNKCKAQYELKSRQCNTDKYDKKINDGSFFSMIERISSTNNPSFFFMHYDSNEVNNLIVVPKCFFVSGIIEKRKPLPLSARRAGWVGCNILLQQIPTIAKIPIIKNGQVLNNTDVCRQYQKVFALQTESIESRGWLFDVLKCVEQLEPIFTLKQMYTFADILKFKHPQNKNIEAKIRQQLQFLRDRDIIEFLKPGQYRQIKNI